MTRKMVILHQDNARPHTAKITHQKIMKFGWEILTHPPYSHDIANIDYHLFQSLQHFLKGTKFKNKNEIQNSLSNFFASKSTNFYQKGIEALPERWFTVNKNDGNYIID